MFSYARVEEWRIVRGSMLSFPGGAGAFKISYPRGGWLFVIASHGEGWEHVSVSLSDRTPTWQEMCFIKSLFWGEEDVVVQFHPPKSEYVNNHNFCLHLWRPTEEAIPLPPSLLVGVKGYSSEQIALMTEAQKKALVEEAQAHG